MLRAGEWEATYQEVDCLSLPFTDRHRRRFRFKADNGLDVLLNLDHAARLRDGDGLVLSEDPARAVRVRAQIEELMEIRADTPAVTVRAAWHIGNRHVPVQIMADGVLRVVYDPVIEDMLIGLGTRPARRAAPFEPEGGAYD